MMKICVVCEDEFVLTPNKPGKINECPSCARDKVITYKACVAFDGKNHGKIDITKDHAYANAFNKAQQRRGYGVVGAVVERKSGKLSTVRTSVVKQARKEVIGGVTVDSKTKTSDIAETYSRR